MGLIGGVLAVIPLFFYDLSEEKHAKIIKVLRLRAACDNLGSGELTDEDVLNVKEITDYATAKNDAFVNEEISKHKEDIETILLRFEEAKVCTEEAQTKEGVAEMLRNLELEDKRIKERTARAKQKAERKGMPFDEQSYIAEQKRKCQYYRHFVDGEFGDGVTYDDIVADAYAMHAKIK